MKILPILLVCLVSLNVINSAFGINITENSWTTKTRMPTARSSFGVGVVNKKIYAIGGFPITNVNEEYDPSTDTWTTRKPMPTARMGFAITVYQNKIYVIGGETDWSSSKGCYIQTNVNEVYDPATDSWETKAPMPAPRSQMTASTVDDKIYVIGGIVDPLNGEITHLNGVYDPQTDKWTTKAEVPGRFYSHGAAVVDNKIYVIDTQFDDGLQIYNPKTDNWTKGAAPPYEAHRAGVAATSGVLAPKRIYVLGGEVGFMEANNTNQVYDPQTDTWNIGNSMPTSRASLAVAVVDDLLYALGGNYPAGNYGQTSFDEQKRKLTLLSNYDSEPLNFVPQENCRLNEQYVPFGYGTLQPIVTITSPMSEVYNASTVPLLFSVDKSVSWMKYSLDGQDNVSITGNTTLTSLSNGTHNLTIYAKYAEGSIGASENIVFTVAKPEPESFPVVPIAASIGVVGIVSISLLIYSKKRRHRVDNT